MIAWTKIVATNVAPKESATTLKRFFSITKSPNCSENGDKNSDVIRSIMAVTAIQRLISERDKGNAIFNSPKFYTTIRWYSCEGFQYSLY